MESWTKIRRDHLQEMISILEKNLKNYEKKDISNWDGYNQEHVKKVIIDTKNLIKQHTEEIEMIDKAR